MSAAPGHYRIGPDQGRVLLRTFREGMASSVGHDLVIELPRWSAELVVAEDSALDHAAATSLTARLDLASLVVREGTGGVKPLTDRDKREIAHTARKLLETDRHPEAVFASSAVTVSVSDGRGGGTVDGTLTLLGVDRPARLEFTRLDDGRYRITTRILQSAYGIKPYSAFFGALKLKDAVEAQAEAVLGEPAGERP